MSQSDRLMWWLGWRPQAAAVIGIGCGIVCAVLFSSPAAFLLGLGFLVLWVRGAKLINENWSRHLDASRGACQAAGARKLGLDNGDGQWRVRCGECGFHFPLVVPSSKYTLHRPVRVGLFSGNLC